MSEKQLLAQGRQDDNEPDFDLVGRLKRNHPEKVAPPQEAKTDRLLESQYRAGLLAGWNFGVVNDEAGFSRSMEAHSWDREEAERLYSSQKAPTGPYRASPARFAKNRWVVEREYLCINGLRAWFVICDVHDPDEAEMGYSEGAIGSAEERAKEIARGLNRVPAAGVVPDLEQALAIANKEFEENLKKIETATNDKALSDGGRRDIHNRADGAALAAQRIASRIRAIAPHSPAATAPSQEGFDEAMRLYNRMKDERGAALAAVEGMSPALRDIATERRRQIDKEGWSLGHDDQHDAGEMARAAASYALSAGPEKVSDLSLIYKLWPWEWRWFKPRSKREDLVRAGALIVAEVERLDRRSLPSTEQT